MKVTLQGLICLVKESSINKFMIPIPFHSQYSHSGNSNLEVLDLVPDRGLTVIYKVTYSLTPRKNDIN